MYSPRNTAIAVGFPIRKSPGQSLLAANRGLSQRATSFIASQCQGIHQMPFSYLMLHETSMHSDKPERILVRRIINNILLAEFEHRSAAPPYGRALRHRCPHHKYLPLYDVKEHPRSRVEFNLLSRHDPGGGERDRTDDLRLAKPALSQLSYTPSGIQHQRRDDHQPPACGT